MRILEVRFKNLNSLAGEWKIDFTHPSFASDGIFAITGPTGSGKTTILDAICLGLYGRTPRLELVTKNGNEIMSRQTGECFAEVTFETQKGRYRCQWSQHRARKKPEGELQQARREISDAVSGKILESKISQAEAFVEKVTGMDFERFTRSMLLAQGSFASFLQADPDKRSPILEQITGTGIYSLISIKVHERRREEQEKLQLLLAELQGFQILGEEEEANIQATLKEKQNIDAELSGKLENLRQSSLWLEGIANLEKDIAELNRQEEEFTQRLRAFAPEAEKLARSRKALGLEGDYRNVVALRTQQETEIRELSDAVASLPEKENLKLEALSLRQTAEARLIEARSTQSSSLDIIKKVREYDARISEQKKQLEEKNRALSALESRSGEYKSSLEKSGQALKKAQSDLEVLHEYESTHAADAALVTHLSVIVRGLQSLKELETRSVLAREALMEAAKKKDAAESAGMKAEEKREECRQKLESGNIELKRLADELDAILQGREIGYWRNVGNNLKEREHLLAQAGTTLERIEQTRKDMDNLKTLTENLKSIQKKLSDEIKSTSYKKEILEKEISSLEVQVSLLSRIHDLEAERKLLEDGKACPLCGSLDHPYAKGNIPQLSGIEETLKNSKADFKATTEIQNKLEARKSELTAEIRHKENELIQKNTLIADDEKVLADLLARLNIEVTPQTGIDFPRREIVNVQANLAQTNQLITRADDQAKFEKAAHLSLEVSRTQFDAAVSAFQESRISIEKANAEYAQTRVNLDMLAKEVEEAREASLYDLEPFGIKQILSQNIDDIVKELTARYDIWQKKKDEKAIEEKKIADLQSEISKIQALLSNLEKDLTARSEERNALKNLCNDQEGLRHSIFGKKNPDEEEKRLAAAIDDAAKFLEKCSEDYQKNDREVVVLKEKIETLNVKTAKRGRELEEASRLFTEKINQSGFIDEIDYIHACLSEDERERIANREKTLLREKTELETRRKDKAVLLALEREKMMTEQSITLLTENITACESDLKQVRLDIGGITQRLSQNEKQIEMRRERLQAIEARKRECARWNTLHDLIGSADGKKFRNFAQGLTFERMTAQANRQLAKMTDRYLLIHDAAQPLELNVIDNYQAGEIRSTRNLSGGESFIVSLALALGLSQMAGRNVRVDSLFLDEGFGTLDDDALETALETLAGLQQDGKIIGIISHVPALKERISIQITVTPERGGCSTLNGPGCRRI